MRMTDEVTVNGKTYDVTQSDGQYSADGGQTWASNAYAATQAASSNSSSSSGSSGSSSHNYKGYSPSEAWGNQPSDKHKGYSPSDAWSGDSTHPIYFGYFKDSVDNYNFDGVLTDFKDIYHGVYRHINARELDEETVQKADRENIPILVSKMAAFELIGRLHALGISGTKNDVEAV